MPIVEVLLILAVICALLMVILGAMDVLKSELSGKDLFRWLAVIIILPVLGFILYLWQGRKSPGHRKKRLDKSKRAFLR